MTNGVMVQLALGQYLDQAAVESLQLTLTIAPAPAPVDPSLPEAPPRTCLPALLDLINARTGVEVGVWRGEFSTHLLANWPGQLYLVDPWKQQGAEYDDVANVSDEAHEANYQATLEAVAPYQDRYTIIRGCSVCAADVFGEGDLDFVFLDADHSYQAVTNDLVAWWPKLRPGGLMAGHDFVDYDGSLGKFRVKSAVMDYVAARNLRLYASREAWPSLWYMVKPDKIISG